MRIIRAGRIAALWTVLLGLGVAGVESAIVTNSSSFSVGYGFVKGRWSTHETSGANQPTPVRLPHGAGIFTNGDFVITLKVHGSFNSSDGVTFTNRSLGNGNMGQTAQSLDTAVSVMIDYIGGTPRDASRQPDYTLQLHLDKLSVYATKVSQQLGGATNEIWWIETTRYQTNASARVATPLDQAISLATNYARIAWAVPDFDALGNHCERSFSFPQDRNFLIDGLEIVGSARLIYIAVPAPSTVR